MDSIGNAARVQSMFGSYDIIETVGQGGMGIVYRAMDVSLDREVAVKVLKEDLRTHPQVVARFQREAEAFASLNHPNIVHIYSVGAVGKIPYIAMEFINGQPLSDIMKRERRMEWKRVLLLGEQIAKALSIAHESHIIHRDIKPGNILVTKDDHAFVTDFGIAKILTAETQLTVEGSRLGTPQYMSPERCRNEDTLASSDLYSLGVLLFQMISGRLPHEGANPVELVHNIVSQPAKRLSEYLPDVPSDVERLIAYLIEKDPRDRPASGFDWAELSERVRAGKPLFEDTDGMSDSMRHFRESMPTPTPASTDGGSFANVGLEARLRKRWQKLNPTMQLGVVSIPIILFALWAGFMFDRAANRDYAYKSIAALDHDMSSWERNLEAATFVQEAPGVQLIQLHMPGFAATPALWTDSDTVLVMLSGTMDEDGMGLRAAGRISLESGDMELVYPPEKLSNLSFLGIQSNANRILVSRTAASSTTTTLFSADAMSNSFLTGFTGDTSFEISTPNTELTHVNNAVWSESRNSWMVIGLSEEEWGIWEFEETGAEPTLALKPGEPIHSLVIGDSALYFVNGEAQAAGELQLWSFDVENPSLMPIASGVTEFDSACMEPDGGRLVAPISGPGSTGTEIQLLDAHTGEILDRLGTGTQAAWHPTGRYLIIQAEDRKGQLQLWGLRDESPFKRVQLTYLNDGVSGDFRIAPAGNHVMVSRNTDRDPELVLVDISVESLTKQGL